VRSHGEAGVTARLLPFTVDGRIWAASMVVLDASHRNQPVARLAAWSLGAGIVATVGANLAHGVGHGPVGALVSAWPALASVGSFEQLMMLIRTRRGTQPGLAEAAPRYPAAPHWYRKYVGTHAYIDPGADRPRATRRAKAIAQSPGNSTSTVARSSASSTKRPDEWLTPAGRDGRTQNDARTAGEPPCRWWRRCWMTSWLLTCVITLVRTSLPAPPRKVMARRRPDRFSSSVS